MIPYDLFYSAQPSYRCDACKWTLTVQSAKGDTKTEPSPLFKIQAVLDEPWLAKCPAPDLRERERERSGLESSGGSAFSPSGLQMPGCENGLQTTDVPAERLVADDLSWCWQDCLRRGSTRIPNRSSGPQNLSSMHNLAERLDAST